MLAFIAIYAKIIIIIEIIAFFVIKSDNVLQDHRGLCPNQNRHCMSMSMN